MTFYFTNNSKFNIKQVCRSLSASIFFYRPGDHFSAIYSSDCLFYCSSKNSEIFCDETRFHCNSRCLYMSNILDLHLVSTEIPSSNTSLS